MYDEEIDNIFEKLFKKMNNKNIILIGFMASGKTKASKEIALRLERRRVSTDELIAQKQGSSIKQVFEEKGEKYFREIESAVVKECCLLKNIVLDCGGGVVLNEENMKFLKESGIVFYLFASPENIFRRTKGRTDRPLLNVENPLEKIKELLASRDPYYRQADYLVDSNQDNIERVVDEIISIYSQKCC